MDRGVREDMRKLGVTSEVALDRNYRRMRIYKVDPVYLEDGIRLDDYGYGY